MNLIQSVFSRTHLYSLSIVNLHNVETKTVDSSPWCKEDTGSEVEVIANIDKYLKRCEALSACPR